LFSVKFAATVPYQCYLALQQIRNESQCLKIGNYLSVLIVSVCHKTAYSSPRAIALLRLRLPKKRVVVGFYMQVQFVGKDQTLVRAQPKARYQMHDLTFRKTVAGHKEAEHGHIIHRAQLRRLLILIDGKKSIGALVAFCRGFEFAGLLSELIALGLIEPISADQVFSPTALQQELADKTMLQPAQFEAARRTAINAASELLGKQARPLCGDLSACQDSMSLRLVMGDVQEKLIQTLGDDAATVFIEAVRDAVRATR
jgi:hypothetical protein